MMIPAMETNIKTLHTTSTTMNHAVFTKFMLERVSMIVTVELDKVVLVVLVIEVP